MKARMAVDRTIWKIILDIIVLACVSFPILALHLWAWPYRRGYFINDESIRLPYKQQTISETVLAVAGFVFIIATVVLVEGVRSRLGKGIGDKFLLGSIIPGYVWESYTAIGVFTFGAACQQFTVNAAKYAIGRLRPHFYEVCQPVPLPGNPLNELGYIQAYTCNGVNEELQKEMRLSFPSAHSSFAMYTAIFFIFYIQVKGRWRGSKLLRHGIQFTVLMLAWYVGLSRITDHMHHWSDVAAGFLIGAGFAVITFIYVLKPKKYGPPESWEQPNQPEILPRAVLVR